MVESVAFSLEASESTPWFTRLGRGVTRIGCAGTWTGTVTFNRKRPDGVEVILTQASGDDASFTSTFGASEVDDPGPYRFTFTRTGGTAEPYAWSDECQIDLPYSYPLQNGEFLLTEGGEYLEMESA